VGMGKWKTNNSFMVSQYEKMKTRNKNELTIEL
jgi:hypothetical protein